jgi:hypothetical protein
MWTNTRIIAYRIKANAYGDLDRATLRFLDKIARASKAIAPMAASLRIIERSAHPTRNETPVVPRLKWPDMSCSRRAAEGHAFKDAAHGKSRGASRSRTRHCARKPPLVIAVIIAVGQRLSDLSVLVL